MLVVNRIELVLLHESIQMRKLHRDRAALAEQYLHARHEIIEIRNVREHIVAEQQVRLAVLGRDLTSGLLAEEFDYRTNPFSLGDERDVRRGLDAEHGYVARDEVLEQIAVVARDLHHATLRA